MTKLSVTPEQLEAGGEATVTITGGPASTTITVQIDNGGDARSSVEVELDENGDGVSTWNVPATGWSIANFNYGDALEITRIIN